MRNYVLCLIQRHVKPILQKNGEFISCCKLSVYKKELFVKTQIKCNLQTEYIYIERSDKTHTDFKEYLRTCVKNVLKSKSFPEEVMECVTTIITQHKIIA